MLQIDTEGFNFARRLRDHGVLGDPDLRYRDPSPIILVGCPDMYRFSDLFKWAAEIRGYDLGDHKVSPLIHPITMHGGGPVLLPGPRLNRRFNLSQALKDSVSIAIEVLSIQRIFWSAHFRCGMAHHHEVSYEDYIAEHHESVSYAEQIFRGVEILPILDVDYRNGNEGTKMYKQRTYPFVPRLWRSYLKFHSH